MVPHVTFPSPSRDAPIWPAPQTAATTARLGVARQPTMIRTANMVSAPVRVSMCGGGERGAPLMVQNLRFQSLFAISGVARLLSLSLGWVQSPL